MIVALPAKIKNAIKNDPTYQLLKRVVLMLSKNGKQPTFGKILSLLNLITRIKIVSSLNYDNSSKETAIFRQICKKIDIKIDPSKKFIYDIDWYIFPFYRRQRAGLVIGNMTIDYEKIIRTGFLGIKTDILDNLNACSKEEEIFLKSLLNIIDSIEILTQRYSLILAAEIKKTNNENLKKIKTAIDNIPLKPARNFREALQSFLIINSLLWNSGHNLVGLGRLDKFLYPYLKNDLDSKNITEADARMLLAEFFKILHRDYRLKSNVLSGDTGQVGIIGGKDRDGCASENMLTEMILDVLAELKLPDPKIVLRVHKNTPNKIWDKALECLSSGVQYPLFASDDAIIPPLVNMGYSIEDAFDYGVSACWEPLVPGKSLDQNNLACVNFLEPLRKTLISDNISKLNTFDAFLVAYKENLKISAKNVIKNLQKTQFEPSPLISLMICDCIKKKIDVSNGGARYNNYGVLSVGLSNTINAIFNIKRLVYKGKYSCENVNKIIKKNFYGYENFLNDIRINGQKFGMDDGRVISLTNDIIETAEEVFSRATNSLGGKFKFGLSSPSYLSNAKKYPASLDGRKFGEPFGTHISPLHFSPALSYTELASFSARLNTKKITNGAVLDIYFEKEFFDKNKQKIKDYLKTYFLIGGVQVHINILDIKTLIEASKDPEKFPNLIVRVWGFCAYFKDLPKEYREIIIKRAEYYGNYSNQNTTI